MDTNPPSRREKSRTRTEGDHSPAREGETTSGYGASQVRRYGAEVPSHASTGPAERWETREAGERMEDRLNIYIYILWNEQHNRKVVHRDF